MGNVTGSPTCGHGYTVSRGTHPNGKPCDERARPSIFRDIVQTDARGNTWRMDESYQDHDAKGEGWLALRSQTGEVMSFTDVVNLYGWVDGAGTRYLRARRGE